MKSMQSSVINNCVNPIWNETILFNYKCEKVNVQKLNVTVYDHDVGGNSIISIKVSDDILG
jgi:hypothetical protein